MAIFFHTVDVHHHLKHKNALKRWINDCVSGENKQTGDINIIFCSDEHLLEMNRTHLAHDFYTDIITFDFTTGDIISGDLYISLDRLQDNALTHKTALRIESYRVIIHGVMHLCGYKDKTKKDAQMMRIQEDKCLAKIDF